jgi:hypothetical protein
LSTGWYYQDCGDRYSRVAAAPAREVIAVAAGFEAELGNRGWVVDQLDANKILRRIQSFPR